VSKVALCSLLVVLFGLGSTGW